MGRARRSANHARLLSAVARSGCAGSQCVERRRTPAISRRHDGAWRCGAGRNGRRANQLRDPRQRRTRAARARHSASRVGGRGKAQAAGVAARLVGRAEVHPGSRAPGTPAGGPVVVYTSARPRSRTGWPLTIMIRLALTVVLVVVLLAPGSAQTGNSAWVSWARANHHPIASLQTVEGDTFADLQFFKSILKDRRIVQLGESGHGVAEFNHAKVRLIKFLHQQMGFDVMAFESGLFECYQANRTAAVNAAAATMRGCIFGVWHTDEVVPLFEYIKSTWNTDRPLLLAGFDTQISSASGI